MPVDRVVSVQVTDGTLGSVTMRTRKGTAIPGTLSSDRLSWLADSRLEPNTGYVLEAVASDAAGNEVTSSARFRSANLALDKQTFPSMSPLAGQQVGVGFPIMVHFDLPVRRRAEFERNMIVTSSVGQEGRWHWIDAQTVHYRPRHYWKPNQKVTVDLKLNSVSARQRHLWSKGPQDRFPCGPLGGGARERNYAPDEGVRGRQIGPHHPDHNGAAAQVHHALWRQDHH
ncbi:MAG: Ig-like domain-containing protein [Marmoricola sp.]